MILAVSFLNKTTASLHNTDLLDDYSSIDVVVDLMNGNGSRNSHEIVGGFSDY